MTFLSTGTAHLFWLAPLVAMLYLWAAMQRRRAGRLFAPAPGVREVSAGARRWKAVLTVAALGLLVLALARPAWDRQTVTVRRRGRDVVFILDVSCSMLAEDVGRNRLSTAKQAIVDCLGGLRGDRAALIVFAGDAVMTCPPTHDYGFLAMMAEDASPLSVSRGGTMLGDAVRRAVDDAVRSGASEHMDIILFTDGGDHGSDPMSAAEYAAVSGIRVIVVGVGDAKAAAPIPIENDDGTRTYLEHRGERVMSRLESRMLVEIANATPEGRYIHIGTDAVDFGNAYSELVASAEKKEFELAAKETYRDAYGLFVAASVILLGVATVLPERAGARKTPAGRQGEVR